MCEKYTLIQEITYSILINIILSMIPELGYYRSHRCFGRVGVVLIIGVVVHGRSRGICVGPEWSEQG